MGIKSVRSAGKPSPSPQGAGRSLLATTPTDRPTDFAFAFGSRLPCHTGVSMILRRPRPSVRASISPPDVALTGLTTAYAFHFECTSTYMFFV